MDPLDPVLSLIRVRGELVASPALCAPWGLSERASDEAIFYLIIEGEAHLRDRSGAQTLRAGDMVIYPTGAAHTIASDLQATVTAQSLDALLDDTRMTGQAGPTCVMHRGRFVWESGGVHPMLDALPERVALTDAATRAHRLQLAAWIQREQASAAAGHAALIARLLEVLWLQAIRQAASAGEASGWLAGLQDVRLARAIAQIHHFPAEPWTVASLANEAHMSRASFASTFSRCVGEPPMTYLTRWRIHLAATYLKPEPDDEAGRQNLADIAAAVGYSSEASFGRAFKKWTGRSPGRWRRLPHAVATEADAAE